MGRILGLSSQISQNLSGVKDTKLVFFGMLDFEIFLKNDMLDLNFFLYAI